MYGHPHRLYTFLPPLMFIAWLIEMATLSLVLIVAFSKVRVLVLW